MIKRVKLRYFKMFEEQEFNLRETIILAGPNNSGKSTYLQAISVWNLALRKWLTERGPHSGSKARKRTGVPITRKDFSAVPLREMNLLWTGRTTGLLKHERVEGQKPGVPRELEICLEGMDQNGPWELTFEFKYSNPEQVYVSPSEKTPIELLLERIADFQVVHIPPFSGIGPEEHRVDKAYQDVLIGQGKPGDIIRNLLLEINRDKPEDWDTLCGHIQDIFEFELLSPTYEGLPYIRCEYLDRSSGKGSKALDISCGGSGFLQVLMLLGFLYARPATVILLDEPDAHLHIILQKQVYDKLREIARQRGSQLLIATHSEVLIDNTSPGKILSFFKTPHNLGERISQRQQLQLALSRLTSSDLLQADQIKRILYTEDQSDLDILREWARTLDHPLYQKFLKSPFWYPLKGRVTTPGNTHFFALLGVEPEIKGVMLIDGDNRNLSEGEGPHPGLSVLRWRRYEIESYLIHPETLVRFLETTPQTLDQNHNPKQGREYLQEQLPPAVFKAPLSEYDYFVTTRASKTLLPDFFEAAGFDLPKSDYYLIAAQMLPDEIPSEVKEKLDLMLSALDLEGPQ